LRVGIRGKLFATAAATVTVMVLVGGLFLEGRLRTSQEEQIETELLRCARAARELVADTPEGAMDAVADQMGEALEARVTVIGLDGRVLGDSEVLAGDLTGLDSHLERPEVLATRDDTPGTTRRHSETLDRDMLYLAIPFEGVGGSGGYVRVALPLDEVDRAAMRLRVTLAVGWALGLALALLGGALVSNLLTRDFRTLMDHARSFAEGRPDASTPGREVGELESLEHSINVMGGELNRHMSTLAEERDRFAAVIEGMDAAVLAVDGQRHITLTNARALRLLRLPPDVDGAPFDQAVRVPELHELLDRAQEEQASFDELTLPGNPPRIATVRITPQRTSGGAVIVMHDITRQQRLETVRRDFVANVSHELRTPMTVIRANAETLLDGAMEDPLHGRQFLSAVLRNAERMTQIVSDLLDLTRIESGKLDLNIRPLPVKVAAYRALDSVAEAAKAKSIDVEIQIDESLQVAADEQLLDQILVNLLDNAVKYTFTGGLVVVEAEQRETGVRIAVRDNGPGIEPEHRDRIFERFYRVDKGRSREMGGTGLGLAIVKHLTGALNGEIGVEAAEGGGTVFWLILEHPADR